MPLPGRVYRIATCLVVMAAMIAWTSPAPASHLSVRERPRKLANEPQVCDGCVPPLIYGGGPVMSTTDKGTTLVPVYWAPAGYAFAPGYQQIVDGYLSNIAAASGAGSNAYSIATEYYQVVDGQRQYVRYLLESAPAVMDTDAYPDHGCRPASGYSACVTDAQLQAELQTLATSHGLTGDLAHFYAVFFPAGVETEDADGTNSANDYCGYHSVFGTGRALTVYANLPYDTSGCDAGQSPNGDLAADGIIDTTSHELNESLTDPATQVAWNDANGNENADMCLGFYGRALGSTDPADPAATLYNQVINGGKYYTQDEFSNYAIKAFGTGKGCQPNETSARDAGMNRAGTSPGGPPRLTAFADASPDVLPADGSSTSSIDVNVSDASGNEVEGDRVHFSVSTKQGSGHCGTLDRTSAKTDANGDAVVTYRSSGSDVECWVQAMDGEGGQVSESVIYQGATQRYAPTLTASFPASVPAGGTTTFAISVANPSSQPIKDASVEMDVFQGDDHSPNVDAGQVQLSYSTTGPQGRWTPIALSGSTGGGYSISGTFDATSDQTLAPGFSKQIWVKLTVAPSAPAYHGPLIALEGYLDQVNDANGSGATLSDTYSTNVAVTGGVAPSSGGGISTAELAAIVGGGIIGVAALTGAGRVMIRRRRRGRPAL